MYSAFLGIEIARRALFANQRAQENVSHNIANANTPGYSRQRVVLESTYASAFSTTPGMGQVGTGVRVADVTRIRDAFTDMQYRNENAGLGQWEVQRDILSQVESIFNEPSDIGISSVLSQFWQSLETLAENAGSAETRETVKERALSLADTINHTALSLNQILDDIKYRLGVKVEEVNTIARQIAELNGQIQTMEITGITASDLRDKRDLLLDELSKIVQIDTSQDEQGLFSVNIGGSILIKGTDYDTFTLDKTQALPQVKWQTYNTPVNMKKGELQGLLDLYAKVTGYRTDLETFAHSLADRFNEIHRQGWDLDGANTNIDFFVDPANLSSNELIAVNPDIIKNTNLIAAAGDPYGGKGDNRNALRLAEIKSLSIDGGFGPTFDDYYGSLISRLGIDSQEAQRMMDSQQYMVSQLDYRRQEISGVSLDEEMTKMIIYQHAYTAAARLITTLDEMMGVVLSMGVTGR